MYEFINEICNILEIPVPTIEVSKIGTETTLAAAIPQDNKILVRNTDISVELCFCLAHELRHLWQYSFDKKYYFSGYKNSSECSSVDVYNQQPAEVDAHAFAKIIIVDFFGVAPTFNGFSKQTIGLIESRIRCILGR